MTRARVLAASAGSWADLVNALFGTPGGLVTTAYPTREARAAFVLTDQYKQIRELVNDSIVRHGLVAGATPTGSDTKTEIRMTVGSTHGGTIDWTEADDWVREHRDDLGREHAALVDQVERLGRDAGPDPVLSRLVAIVSDLMAGGSAEEVIRAGVLMRTLKAFVIRHPCVYSIYGSRISEAARDARFHMTIDHPGYVVRQ